MKNPMLFTGKGGADIKLLKYTKYTLACPPLFLIEINGVEYVSFREFFLKNTPNNLAFMGISYVRRLFSSTLCGFENVVDGRGMLYGCDFITSFEIDMPNLTNGDHMFVSCTNLITVKSNVPKLICNPRQGFRNCPKLRTVNFNLSDNTDVLDVFDICPYTLEHYPELYI